MNDGDHSATVKLKFSGLGAGNADADDDLAQENMKAAAEKAEKLKDAAVLSKIAKTSNLIDGVGEFLKDVSTRPTFIPAVSTQLESSCILRSEW